MFFFLCFSIDSIVHIYIHTIYHLNVNQLTIHSIFDWKLVLCLQFEFFKFPFCKKNCFVVLYRMNQLSNIILIPISSFSRYAVLFLLLVPCFNWMRINLNSKKVLHRRHEKREIIQRRPKLEPPQMKNDSYLKHLLHLLPLILVIDRR